MTKQTLSLSGRQTRWGLLGLTAAPLLGACAYNLGCPIPSLICPIQHWTGIPCPTCGMTRSFMAIARGDVLQALQYHLFGPVLFLIFLITVVHISWELWHQQKLSGIYFTWMKRRRFILSSLGLYGVYYGLRLYYLYATGALVAAWQQAPLSQLF